MIPFPFNENRFSFFVADHLLVGQLCTNPKSDRSLLSCLKVTQCSTSEIGDAPQYNSCSLPIQLMTTGPLPAPLKCKSGLPRITGTCPEWWKQSFWLRLRCGFKWGPHHATSHLRSRLESQHQSVPGCAEECGDPLVQPDGRWQTLGVAKRTRRWPTNPKRPRLDFRRSATTLYPSLSGLLPPPTWTGWTTSFGHTSRTSPTWPPTTPKPAWSPPSAEYSPSSPRRLWKRHAPSSGSVSRWWLRLKAATLNRYQLYYIIMLRELIFSIKVLK